MEHSEKAVLFAASRQYQVHVDTELRKIGRIEV
jgi:hypothetical protein